MEHLDEAARHRENLALADLVGFLGEMLLIAGIVVLLLGGYGYEKDRQERLAMIKTVGTITEEYVHGGAYYVVYEADGATHEALMDYERGKLNVGDQVDIRYHPEYYNDVRFDGPKDLYMKILGYGALGFVLGGLALFTKVYLRHRDANPWHREEYEA